MKAQTAKHDSLNTSTRDEKEMFDFLQTLYQMSLSYFLP